MLISLKYIIPFIYRVDIWKINCSCTYIFDIFLHIVLTQLLAHPSFDLDTEMIYCDSLVCTLLPQY